MRALSPLAAHLLPSCSSPSHLQVLGTTDSWTGAGTPRAAAFRKKSHSCQLPALGRHTIQSNLQSRSFPQTPKTTELSTAPHFSDPILNALKTA